MGGGADHEIVLREAIYIMVLSLLRSPPFGHDPVHDVRFNLMPGGSRHWTIALLLDKQE